MWRFLVLSHGVFVSILNMDNSIKTLLSIVCNSSLSDFESFVRGFEKRVGYKKGLHLRNPNLLYSMPNFSFSKLIPTTILFDKPIFKLYSYVVTSKILDNCCIHTTIHSCCFSNIRNFWSWNCRLLFRRWFFNFTFTKFITATIFNYSTIFKLYCN